MKKILLSVLLLCCSFKIDDSPHAVTYTFSGGRFGDNLLAYLHAKWISYKYKIPLLYKEFDYSDQLKLHDYELDYNIYKGRYVRKIDILQEKINLKKSKPTLFISPYFPENIFEMTRLREDKSRPYDYFDTGWRDPGFRKLVEKAVKPKYELNLLYPSRDRINIAVHARHGGGYDSPLNYQYEPNKVPPNSFYVDGLIKMIEVFKGKPLYCYIFTDAQNPAEIVEKITAELYSRLQEIPSIEFDYRREGNRHDANVLEDFFSMMNFDALIHPLSNYSIVASVIHDYAVTFAPISFVRDPIKIDKVDVRINRELVQKLK